MALPTLLPFFDLFLYLKEALTDALLCVCQVCKVYLGSFNDKPIRTDLNPHGKELFEKEQENLLQDLYEIPQRSCDRKACCLLFLIASTRSGCSDSRLSDCMALRCHLDHQARTQARAATLMKASVAFAG